MSPVPWSSLGLGDFPRYEEGAMSAPHRSYVSPIPFGLGRTKPQHYRAMLRVLWENRDHLGHAWRVLTQGTCDGCALGTIGLHDWTLGEDEVHLCTVRLELLRLNTMGAIADAERALADV